MLKNVFAVLIATLSIAIQTQQKAVNVEPTAAPPEVKQTVNALAGTWAGQMTARIPGYPTETFNWLMDCKQVAKGAGVACTNGGNTSIGELSESCLFAFDPDGKAVHYMCVTSMGEVHDHKGHWRDGRVLEFEPLRAGMMGRQVVETLRWQFIDVNTLVKNSTVTMPDGSRMNFEFNGKRK